MNQNKYDLVALDADGQMEAALNGILNRNHSLGIRSITYKILVHGSHDPGCLNRGHEMLRLLKCQYDHAIIMFDREGCGRERLSRDDLEGFVERNLQNTGWGDKCVSIVIDPELETWVWTESPHVEEVLGWKNKNPPLREWLVKNNYYSQENNRIALPKEAMINALRTVGKSSSSSYFLNLAKLVSFERCRDGAFHKLRATLQRWFPQDEMM